MSVPQQDNPALGTTIGEQICRTWSTLLVSISISLLGILGIFALSSYSRLPFGYFTRDPAAITHSKFYIGALSNLGIMLWSATAAICFFGAFFLRTYKNVSQFKWFLFSWGVLTLMLTLDDAFLFHESFFPEHLRIPEELVELCYLIIAAGCLVQYYRLIRRTNYLLLVLAIMFLGASVATDSLFPNSDLEIFIEDSLKFSGIVFWLAYFFNTAIRITHDECLTIVARAHES